MKSFYCIYCQDLCPIEKNIRIFHTGFMRVEQVDYAMGICWDHRLDEAKEEKFPTTEPLGD